MIIQNKFLKTQKYQLGTLQRTEVIAFFKSLRSMVNTQHVVIISVNKNNILESWYGCFLYD